MPVTPNVNHLEALAWCCNLIEAQRDRIPIFMFAGKHASALKVWMKLDTAFQINKRELPETSTSLLEVYHIKHFMIGIEDQFISKVLDDGYTTWEEIVRESLRHFYTPR
jgi:hypothetical protein